MIRNLIYILLSIKDFVAKKKKKNDSSSHHAFHATTNEIKNLKNKMNNLSSTLNSCAFNHSKLESLFQKKQVPHAHAHTHHAHAYGAHHDHNHTHMHTKVYKCTHCDRKGHLAKFCFDKLHYLNFAKKNVWVPFDANPVDPKQNGYQNPHLVFLMSMRALTKRERDGALVVGVWT